MSPAEILKKAWARAGYPPPVGPLVTMLQAVSVPVHDAFKRGEDDFVAAGWRAAGEDFPFVTGHPRYRSLTDAYRTLAEAH